MNKLYIIKLKNGESIFINELQYSALKRTLMLPFRERPEFFSIDEEIIKIDYIASVKPDKE